MTRADLLADIWDLYEHELWDEALRLTRLELASNPDDGRLWELRGLIHRRRSDFAACQYALESATTLVPLGYEPQCALAECYLQAGQLDLAAAMYGHLVVNLSDVPTSCLKYVVIGVEALGDLESALAVSQEAATREPTWAEPRYAMAYFMGQLGYPAELVADRALEAVSLAPERPQYRIGLAGLMQQMGRVIDAYGYVRVLSAADIQGVPCSNCLNKLATIYREVGDNYRELVCREEIMQRQLSGDDHDCGDC